MGGFGQRAVRLGWKMPAAVRSMTPAMSSSSSWVRWACMGIEKIRPATYFFDIDGFDRESIEETFEETEKNSQQGGSGFEPPDPWNPVGYLFAVVTVLTRPFVWEADSIQMLGTALEGLFLAGLLAVSVPKILRAGTRFRSWAYATMSLAYLAGFSFAFASIANFGILARQRTQLLPFVFVLVCLPAVGEQVRRRAGLGRHPAHLTAPKPSPADEGAV